MQRFEWDETLATGVTLLDQQHREWIAKLNVLAEAIASDSEVDHISKTLNYIVAYSEFHFAAEEQLMAEHNYPDLEQHKQEHKKFREALADLLVSQVGQADALRKISASVKLFQTRWLIHHIRTVDRKFAEFLDENVSTATPEAL